MELNRFNKSVYSYIYVYILLTSQISNHMIIISAVELRTGKIWNTSIPLSYISYYKLNSE